ncbi:MAG TPA: LacI family DNA-binding transcriptional regulator [Ktedonobacteraceae bacterium]|nr:LacI family DNA-binding transcriptional regulator [Ktedonobacteraceae bacterium]
MAGPVTLKDIAKEAQVSIGTVSRVFNNHTNVTEEMRQKVLRAATLLGYFGTGGQEQRSHDSGRLVKEIGFLFCTFIFNKNGIMTNPFWSHILHGVESEASKFNIKVTYRSIGNIQHNPDALLTTIYELKLGGILLVGPAEAETVRIVQSTGLPLLLVDNYVPQAHSVLGSNFEGARAAVEHLISMGHRQIAFIGGPVFDGERPINKVYTIERRAEGYRMALVNAGLPVSYDLCESGNLSTDQGYEACKRLLQRGKPFTALFCANDEMAVGAMKALREVSLRVPEDVSLVGFDDIDLVQHIAPALTTVKVDKEALGSLAVKRLLSLMSNPEPVYVSNVLEVELVIRDSVKRLTTQTS